MSAAKSIDIKKSVVDTVLAGLISLIVFGPIVGVVLDGYGFNLQPARVAVLVAIVMVGRFAMSLFLQTPKGAKILQGFETSGSGVHVLPPDYKSRLRWIIPALIVIAIVFPIFANKYLLTVVILGLIYVLLGLGLNIVVGLAGLLDLGYVAFYAIGAYGLALGYQYLGLGFWRRLRSARRSLVFRNVTRESNAPQRSKKRRLWSWRRSAPSSRTRRDFSKPAGPSGYATVRKHRPSVKL
ncbi:MAG: branched-chain amino acid transport system permease protein [Pseudomonas sp.]|nr:branched-chain amino acid transport system permease protein [Pseudomonas sp.]